MVEILKKRVFILYASAEWGDESHLNVHFYARELSKLGYRVIFIESIGLRKPQLKKSSFDKMRVIKRLLRLIFMPVRKRGKIFILTPLYFPLKKLNSFFSFVLNFQIFLLSDFYKRVHWVFLPTFYNLLNKKKNEDLIYHAVDNYAENPDVNSAEIKKLEQKIIRKARYVFCTSRPLKEKLEKYGKSVYLFSNRVVDCTLKKHKNTLNLKVKHPALVYLGNIVSYNLDFDFIENIVRKNKNLNFYFIGTVNKGERDMEIPFKKFPNVYFLSSIPHKYVLDVLTQFDGGFFPYIISERTKYSFPMKYMEYLLAGLPIYSTKLPSLLNEKYLFFLEKNDKIILKKYSDKEKEEIKSYVRKYCWEKRIKEVLKVIESKI